MSETQRRRPQSQPSAGQKTTEKGEHSEADEKQVKMQYVVKTNVIKKGIILVIGLVLLWKLWQLFATPSRVPTLPEGDTVVGSWKYSMNPQGSTEQDLSDLLGKIKRDEDLPAYKHGKDVENMEVKIHKLGKTYRSPGSLKFEKGEFILDGKKLRLFSGAMHYFRVMPDMWKHHMMQMKACGLNTLETYVSWNLHEEYPGEFKFTGMLDIRKYIKLAQEVGLYVILRPGPYICSEWDFGGLPSWLLKDPEMKVRTNYPGYLQAVERYFNKLIPLVADLQYSNGGPIIAVQVENEFGSYSNEVAHLLSLKKMNVKLGIKEMLFTSDGMTNRTAGATGFHTAPFYDEALPMVNFKAFDEGKVMIDAVKGLDPEFPVMVMEFWSGWFDHWNAKASRSTTKVMAYDLQQILKSGASVNFYMFHGGTNFGFTAGANWFANTNYKPDITSYDYIAPLSEAGDVTPKFEVIRAMLEKHGSQPGEARPVLPTPLPDMLKADYGTVAIQSYLPFENLLNVVKPIDLKKPVAMEMLDLHNTYGQNFGYILYRAHINRGSRLKFLSPAKDRAQVLLNKVEVQVFDWFSTRWQVDLPASKMADENMLDILVENHGRVNYVRQGFDQFNKERKGMEDTVLLDEKPIDGWRIYPLHFNEAFITKLTEADGWMIFTNWENRAAVFRGTLIIDGKPGDTFINMQGWQKGIVIINGFNLGRYWSVGPQKTLYVPASVLKSGQNQVLIFEQHKASHSVKFQSVHVLR